MFFFQELPCRTVSQLLFYLLIEINWRYKDSTEIVITFMCISDLYNVGVIY